MTKEEYEEMVNRRNALGDDWRILLEDILDDLIEFNNSDVDLYELTEKAFRLRDLLKQEIGESS